MASSYSKDKIFQILSLPEPASLENDYEIEDVIFKIEEIDKEIEWFEKLKKKRTQTIDESIQKIKTQKDFLRKVVQLTLDKIGEESLSFPGVGVVSKAKGKTTWTVIDKEKLIGLLQENLPQDKFDSLVEKKPTIDKRKLDILLDNLEKAGELPDCVKKEEGESSLKIRIAKDDNLTKKDNNLPAPSNNLPVYDNNLPDFIKNLPDTDNNLPDTLENIEI